MQGNSAGRIRKRWTRCAVSSMTVQTGIRAMTKPRKTVNHPWVQAAVFCDQVLEDKSGAYSIIRIVDRYTLPQPENWDGKTHLNVPVITLLAFKSGDVKGERTIKLYSTSPKGKKKKMFEGQITFLGGNVGVNIILRLMFGFKTIGTHWIDVYIGNWLATRMPLTIELQPIEKSPSEGESQGQTEKSS
jgi:hypothetical protein